jgi:hypothetical protein
MNPAARVKSIGDAVRAFRARVGDVYIVDHRDDRTRLLARLFPDVQVAPMDRGTGAPLSPQYTRCPVISFNPPFCSPLSYDSDADIRAMVRYLDGEWKPLTINEKEQGFIDAVKKNETDICSGLGVPQEYINKSRPRPTARASAPARVVQATNYKFRTTPYKHQRDVFERSRDLSSFALFMEMGTGKSKVVIDNAAFLFAAGKIDGVLVVAPNGIHRNWITNEFPVHFPTWTSYVAHIWTGAKTKTAEREIELLIKPQGARLAVLSMNVESFSTERGVAVARRFLSAGRRMMVVDESTTIKTPGAKRTKSVIRCRSIAPYRRILTGTPITQGPFDLFAPLAFLDPEILGFTSFYAFKHYFAVWEKRRNAAQGVDYEELINYVHLDELVALVAPHSFRITKDECIDLPPKSYSIRPVEPTDEQARLYKRMSDELMVEINDRTIVAPIVLTKLLRLSQITGGFIGSDENDVTVIPGGNPKVDALVEIAESVQGKTIIWARFIPEIKEIARALRDRFGRESVVEYWGGVDNDTRAANIVRFQDPNHPARFFVGTPRAGGMGITLTAAGTVVYFSNDYSLQTRLQSEDRSHRIGQTKNVHYIDLEMVGTIDQDVVAALRKKQDIAEFINRDNIRRIMTGQGVARDGR